MSPQVLPRAELSFTDVCHLGTPYIPLLLPCSLRWQLVSFSTCSSFSPFFNRNTRSKDPLSMTEVAATLVDVLTSVPKAATVVSPSTTILGSVENNVKTFRAFLMLSLQPSPSQATAEVQSLTDRKQTFF